MGGILLAGVASFSRAIAELGVAQMVGGNILHVSQVLTTVIANETQLANLDVSIALTIILLAIVFGITLAVNVFQRRRK
jgi:tungstate transport system permease protein